jgi:hypothetical protein
MKVEIFECKPTMIVAFSIPNDQMGVEIALSTAVLGIVAFFLVLVRALGAWGSGLGILD